MLVPCHRAKPYVFDARLEQQALSSDYEHERSHKRRVLNQSLSPAQALLVFNLQVDNIATLHEDVSVYYHCEDYRLVGGVGARIQCIH